jgi:hypothetical protein
VRTIYLLFIAAVLAACAAVIVPLEKQYTDDPVQKANRGEISPLSDLSMLRAGNAQRALEAIRAKSPVESRVQSLTLRPTQVDATVVVPADGTQHDFLVDPAFHIDAREPRDASTDYGMTFRRFDLSVPEGMIRAVLTELDRSERDVAYVSASIPSDEHTKQEWLLYLEHGRIRDRVWRADGDGSHLRRNGT